MVRNAVRQMAHCRLGAALCKAPEERRPENLQALPAGDADSESAIINADLLAFIRGLQPPLRQFRSHITEKENPDASRQALREGPADT